MASFASWATKIVVALALCVHPDGVDAFGKPLDKDLTEFPFASVSTAGLSCPLTDGDWAPTGAMYNIDIKCNDEDDDEMRTEATYSLIAYDMSGNVKVLSLVTESAEFRMQIMMACEDDECTASFVETQNAEQRAEMCCALSLEDCISQTSVISQDSFGATFKSCMEEFEITDESASIEGEEYCPRDSPFDDGIGCDEAMRCYYECGAEHIFPADGETCNFEDDDDLVETDKDFACCMLDECNLDMCDDDWEHRAGFEELFEGNCYGRRNLRAGAKLGAGAGVVSANFRAASKDIVIRTREVAARASTMSKSALANHN